MNASLRISYRALVALGLVIATACGSRAGKGSTLAGDAGRRASADDGAPSAVAVPSWIHEGGGIRDCYETSGSAEVDLDPTADTAAQYPWPTPFSDGLGPIVRAPWGPSLRRVVLADRGRGLRVVTAPEQGEIQVAPSFELPARPLDLRVLGDYALLTLQTNAARRYELWWLKLHEDAAPDLIARATEIGELRGSHLLPARGSAPPQLAQIVDVYGEGDCVPRAGTLVRVLELRDDAMVLKQELELGAGVMRVLRSGGFLLVSDQREAQSGERSYGARVIDLAAWPLAASERRATGSLLRAFHADGRSLDLVYSEREQVGPVQQGSIRERFAIEQLKLTGGKLQATKTCTLENTAAPSTPERMVETAIFTQALFMRDRVLMIFADGDDQKGGVRVVQRNGCKTSELLAPGKHFMLTPDGRTLVGLSPYEGSTLDVHVYDAKRPSAPLASAHVELAKPEVRADSVLRDNNYYWPSGARWHTVGKELLLAVSFREYGRGGSFRAGTQLFEIDHGAATARTPLDASLWLSRPDGRSIYSDESGLTFDDQHRDLWTRHLVGKLLHDTREDGMPHGIARIRYPHVASRYDAHTDALLAQLELVPGELDPHTGQAAATFEISGNARLDVVGTLLVASSQEIARSEGKPSRPCHIDVYDTKQLVTATRLASLVETTLCDEDHALSDNTILTTAHGLVLGRQEFQYKSPNEVTGIRIALRALDLRDPKAPVIRGPFRTPEGEYALGTFSDGTRVVQAFRVAAPSRDAQHPLARFYIRTIDFSDPAAPRFDEPIATPGELIALDGETLYTREANWRGDKADFIVHKLFIHDGKLEPLASGLDERAVYDRYRARDRFPGVEDDDTITDTSPDEVLVLKQGALRRVRKLE